MVIKATSTVPCSWTQVVISCYCSSFRMMESGLLPKDLAKKVFEKKQKKAQQLKLGSPMKTVVTVKKTTESVTIKKTTSSSTSLSTQKKKTPDSGAKSKQQSKKRKLKDDSSEEDSDDDFVATLKSTKRQRAS